MIPIMINTMLATRKDTAIQFQIFMRDRPDAPQMFEIDPTLIVSGFKMVYDNPDIVPIYNIKFSCQKIKRIEDNSVDLQKAQEVYDWYKSLTDYLISQNYPCFILPYCKYLNTIITENFDGYLSHWPNSRYSDAERARLAIAGLQQTLCLFIIVTKNNILLPAIHDARGVQILLTGINQYSYVELPDGPYDVIIPGVIYVLDIIGSQKINNGDLSFANIINIYTPYITDSRIAQLAAAVPDTIEGYCKFVRVLGSLIDTENF